ncbi:2-oxo-4-hydroxy-4-carboxy-5-ureidoimidazoline decarboxylase [Paenibacillus endophyticus]|uniref:2-oxo-4-hydroxy-4-carboxy-5-ureidoimidazoline decarboxylase n=1 Tax=Paenibacillus endophyticus TaxID=1294268 RepID=A0A7W5C6B5_9BACL|nr:2-oxo-4-hydroxy-4-carboxy-5-ureidoimidazoline decarboxylase [Paenibacillus endophyticus]MBB3151955.1 2-oxo-4-hydroxy-4-carboxy-5-ureidoimidazoline decarboxylase [Paenibacillus endophyticus]
MSITLEELNASSREQFIEKLGAVFEHSPWIAASAFGAKPFASIEALHAVMINVVRESRMETIIDLFRAHPDLGTRLAVAEYSAKEQQGAGLNQLSHEEYEQFSGLNQIYVKTFGFPFILAVKGKNKEQILAAMESRIWHTSSEEIEQALLEIEKISGFRLRDLIIE